MNYQVSSKSPPWVAFGHSCPFFALASPVASSGCRHFSPIYMTPGTKKSSKKSVKEAKRGFTLVEVRTAPSTAGEEMHNQV